MSSLVVLVGTPGVHDEEVARTLLAQALRDVSCTVAIARPAPEVMLGVASREWDEPASRRLASDGRFTVVAHGAIYYRHDLSAALAGAGFAPLAPEASAAEAIVAAIGAWGAQGVSRLEGEFAFIAWDARERRLTAARDHGGSRGLYYTQIGAGLAVATALRTIRRVPGCSAALNVLAIAEDVADIDLAVTSETAYSAIVRVPAGHVVEWQQGQSPDVRRWWEIPVFQRDSGLPFDEAAAELRQLIADAVRERSDLARGTAVMLSGGYDSSAVYAAGNWALGGEGRDAPLRAVSLSHPEGDPGREDEMIEQIVQRWSGSTHWIPSEEIPAFDDPLDRARLRDDPSSHTYELWNAALAAGCRNAGSRIAMNGNGGDPWFSVSPLFLADLFRRAQFGPFAREWKAVVGRMDWHRLFKVAIQPNLSPVLLRAIAMARGGRPVSDRNARPIPEWLHDDLRRSPELRLRRQLAVPRRRGESLSAAEQAWFLQASFPERTNLLVFEICQREGVELRTPLLDSRVIRFAATRPRWEANSGRQNKRLLRRSMEGLLPAEIVAPRASRTGLPTTYFHRTMHAHLLNARQEFRSGMFLADQGIVSHRKLLGALDDYIEGRDEDLERGVALFSAIQAEWWFRTGDSN
ncbi:MAG: asparagine synthase-related protein [Gemmatimonadaceae bacterium]